MPKGSSLNRKGTTWESWNVRKKKNIIRKNRVSHNIPFFSPQIIWIISENWIKTHEVFNVVQSTCKVIFEEIINAGGSKDLRECKVSTLHLNWWIVIPADYDNLCVYSVLLWATTNKYLQRDRLMNPINKSKLNPKKYSNNPLEGREK